MKSIQEFVSLKKEVEQIRCINNYLLLISITQQIEKYVNSVIRENVRKDFKLGPSAKIKPFAQIESFVKHDPNENLENLSKFDLRTVRSLHDCQTVFDENHVNKMYDDFEDCFPEADIETDVNDEKNVITYFPMILKRQIFGNPLREVLQTMLQDAGYPFEIKPDESKQFIPDDVYRSDLDDSEKYATLIIRNDDLRKVLH